MKGSPRGTKAQLLLRVIAIYTEVVLYHRETQEDDEEKMRLLRDEYENPTLTDPARSFLPIVPLQSNFQYF